MTDVDWEQLRAVARDAMSRAYAPYSGYPVGVAARVDDGRIISGCNVENASYGLGLCAECGLVSALHSSGGGRLVALACRSGAGDLRIDERSVPIGARVLATVAYETLAAASRGPRVSDDQ